jgi:hypothetical protein
MLLSQNLFQFQLAFAESVSVSTFADFFRGAGAALWNEPVHERKTLAFF